MTKIFTCILCPNGCEIKAECDGEKVLCVSGNRCPKGSDYVAQELKNPTRNIASSVLVLGGELPLCSVRLTRPIPREEIPNVMRVIKNQILTAPVSAGQTIVSSVCGLDSDVIATRSVGIL